MAYLDNTSITLDAVLTKRGRELLSRGDGSFKITKFALSDDEVDYRLYDFAHTRGSNFYGEAIERLPVLEAFPDEAVNLKFKLITLPKNTTRIPILNVGGATNYTVASDSGDITTINPTTTNGTDLNYTATVSDTSVITIEALGAGSEAGTVSGLSAATGAVGVSVSVIGTQFRIRPVYNAIRDRTTTVVFTGNNTGAQAVVTFKILKATGDSSGIAIAAPPVGGSTL